MTRGAILDVVVDLSPESSTYLRHIAVELSADNHRALYAPERFAHGYQVLEDATETSYQGILCARESSWTALQRPASTQRGPCRSVRFRPGQRMDVAPGDRARTEIAKCGYELRSRTIGEARTDGGIS